MSRAAKSSFFILFFFLTWLAFAVSAPAPLPRPLPKDRPQPPRECVLVWHGGRYDALFRSDRHYAARSVHGGSVWVGRWSLDGLTLTVVERLADHPDSYPLTWQLTLGAREGAIYLEPARVD